MTCSPAPRSLQTGSALDPIAIAAASDSNCPIRTVEDARSIVGDVAVKHQVREPPTWDRHFHGHVFQRCRSIVRRCSPTEQRGATEEHRSVEARSRRSAGRITNQLIRGNRGVTPDTALRLADLTGTSPEFRLNLQNRNDLWHAQQERAERRESHGADRRFDHFDWSVRIAICKNTSTSWRARPELNRRPPA